LLLSKNPGDNIKPLFVFFLNKIDVAVTI